MIVILVGGYVAVLALFVWLQWIPLNRFWKISPLIVFVVLLIGLFIPMNWGAPQGPVLVMRDAVQIIPDVAGEVTELPIEANKPIKAGDVLFRIDATPYQAQVDAIEAQLKFQTLRLEQMEQLQSRGTGRGFDVEQRQAEVEQLKAQLAGARWNLDKTVQRAPADGYVTNLGLRKGARVSTAPVMAFIDTSETKVGVEISQISARYVAPGQRVEVTFKASPGVIYTGKVETVLQAIASGQTQTSGFAVAPPSVTAVPFVVRIALDDKQVAARLPAGSTGTAAIFTDRIRPAHMIRRVMLRQVAILNYVLPF